MTFQFDANRSETARNCLWLVEQIAAKYNRATAKESTVPRITPEELARLRAQGITVEKRPCLTVTTTEERKQRSIFDPAFGKRGRRIGWNPAPMRAAVLECLELEASGERRQGQFKAIAAKHQVHYGTLMDRLQIERRCGSHGVRAVVQMAGAA